MTSFDARETSVSKHVSPEKESRGLNRDSHHHFNFWVKNPFRYEKFVIVLLCTSIFIALWSDKSRMSHNSQTQRMLLADLRKGDKVYTLTMCQADHFVDNCWSRSPHVVGFGTLGKVTGVDDKYGWVIVAFSGVKIKGFAATVTRVRIQPYLLQKMEKPGLDLTSFTLPGGFKLDEIVFNARDIQGRVAGLGFTEDTLTVEFVGKEIKNSENPQHLTSLNARLDKLERAVSENTLSKCWICKPTKYRVAPCNHACFLCSDCVPKEEERHCPVCKKPATDFIVN